MSRFRAPTGASALALAALHTLTGCCPAASTPQPEAAGGASAPPPAPRRWTVESSEIIGLSSRETGRDYDLIVGLPPSFGKEPGRKYPALYLTDGQWDFSLVSMLAGGLRYDRVAPEFLIVAITYAGDSPDYEGLRREDYTPTRVESDAGRGTAGGDASKFLAFLESSVIPLVEARYQADPGHRILSGHSLGGLFALCALFERPELFHTVLSLSPAAGWDERYLFDRERVFRQAHPPLDHRVWLSVGDSEWPHFTQAAREFFEQFQASAYEGVTLQVRVVEGEAHAGVKPESYNRAIRFAFQPWAEAHEEGG